MPNAKGRANTLAVLQQLLKDGLEVVANEAESHGAITRPARTPDVLAKMWGLDWLNKTPVSKSSQDDLF